MASRKKNTWLRVLVVLVIIGIVGAVYVYQILFAGNVSKERKADYLYVHTGYSFDEVLGEIRNQKLLRDVTEFERVARKMNYPNHIIPGRYHLKQGMGNVEVVRMLRSGNQEMVKFTLGKVRSLDDIANAVGRKLEANSNDVLALYENEPYLDSLGFNQRSLLGMFIPNTYEFKWNTNARQFLQKMKGGYAAFWTDKRKAKAKSIKLTQNEVATLASIVDEETLKNDEKPTIAGVYYNRLQKGMKLEADPTVKFAAGDFAARRITRALLNTESPYNTYRVTGLPPGPICTPSTSSLDAVLNLQDHNYIYFCAKEDFSGYHNFAATLAQHQLNARKYHRALNQRGIYK